MISNGGIYVQIVLLLIDYMVVYIVYTISKVILINNLIIWLKLTAQMLKECRLLKDMI